MEKSEVAKILTETEQGYDRIAEKFSQTRKRFWNDLGFISKYAVKGDKVLDYGCGNGRLLELFSEKAIDYTGLDISGKMINIAKSTCENPMIKFRKITSFDSLTFPDNFFNIAYSIAVFHHLPDKILRQKVASELYRVVKAEGFVVVTVWNLWQKKYYKNIIINWLNKLIGRSRLDWNDCWLDFKDNKGNIFNRYHHAFKKKELENLFMKAGFSKEKSEIVSGKNIIFIGRKSALPNDAVSRVGVI